MDILKITYIKDGLFLVNYNNIEVVQCVRAIELNNPLHEAIRPCLIFTRNIKIEKLKDKSFTDIDFRDQIIYESGFDSNHMLDAGFGTW